MLSVPFLCLPNVTLAVANYSYDADNRLVKASGTELASEQQNEYNGFGQRTQKKEGSEVTNYFYDGTSVLYTTDSAAKVTAFNLIGAEDNILSTARPSSDGRVDFYTYTKDIRESTINLIGSNGQSAVSYSYDDYGETTILGGEDFYNEVCYGAGIYDKTTGLYYLNARYYSPETGNFLTQDTYRGDRSRTATLNLYGYCAGNPINYTDPSGHWFWGVVGAAFGAHDGYKYAKKKKYTGWKRAACVVGGAILGAVNPCKVFKAVKTGYKAYKASKYAKRARSGYKKYKSIRKALKKPKILKKAKKKVVKVKRPASVKKHKQIAKKKAKTVNPIGCFVAGTKVSTEKGFKAIEHIKPGDYVWSENPETHEKALKKVKKIFVREKDSIIRLAVNGEVIETTKEHPFYVEGKGFTEAKYLKAGDKVRLQSGETAAVEETELITPDEPVTVYNFEVDDFHTYYVSEQQVLVHNTCAEKFDDDIVNGLPKNQGYSSFRKLKKAIGKAGDDKEWHHIVEQSQIKKSGFSKESIHNTSNIIAVDKSTHRKITGHYNSKPDHLGGQSVREWLSSKNYEAQRQYGIKVLKDYGVIK